MVKQYGAACVGTIIAIGLYLSVALAPANAGARPLVCVLVPHFKDEYWLSVGFGLEEEASRQDISLLFFEAGGYRARAAQIEQLDACVERGADAILLGAVTSDHPDLMEAIARVAQDVPVFGLVNELHSEDLSGRIGVDWTDMGFVVGQHLAGLHPAGTAQRTAVFLTGPKEAGWTQPLEAGLREGLADSSVTIAEVFRADTGLRAQLEQVEAALMRHPGTDYLIGNAPAIEAAFGLFAAQAMPQAPKLLSTYVNHSVRRGLGNGQVIAAAFDDPLQQGVMAIRMVSSGAPWPDDGVSVGPEIELLTGSGEASGRVRASPADYFPTIQ